MAHPEIGAKALLQLYLTKANRRLNWKQVAELSGVDAETLVLLAQGHILDMETTALACCIGQG